MPFAVAAITVTDGTARPARRHKATLAHRNFLTLINLKLLLHAEQEAGLGQELAVLCEAKSGLKSRVKGIGLQWAASNLEIKCQEN